jgi:hypothetical protein
MNDYISDEMLAAYIDGTGTPLEKQIVELQLNEENIRETIELASEFNEGEAMDNMPPIDISRTIDCFLKPFEEYKELKKDLYNDTEDTVV